jgi:hypothetical protein
VVLASLAAGSGKGAGGQQQRSHSHGGVVCRGLQDTCTLELDSRCAAVSSHQSTIACKAC